MAHEGLPYKNRSNRDDAITDLAMFNMRFGTSSDVVADSICYVEAAGIPF